MIEEEPNIEEKEDNTSIEDKKQPFSKTWAPLIGGAVGNITARVIYEDQHYSDFPIMYGILSFIAGSLLVSAIMWINKELLNNKEQK
jgi:lipoprotein signal peptidase